MQEKFNGRRVRAWCVDAGISIEELADRIGVRYGTLKSWIYNKRSIDFANACLIANYFGKSLDDLRETVPAA